jgi:baculoviral IAP repeat-containing protein 6
MILIPDPYFNEPGWEASRGTPKGAAASKAYNDNLLPHTIRYAMISQIAAPSACFKKVRPLPFYLIILKTLSYLSNTKFLSKIIHTHFYLKRDEIKAQLTGWVRDSKGPARAMLQVSYDSKLQCLCYPSILTVFFITQAEVTRLFNDLDKLTLPN